MDKEKPEQPKPIYDALAEHQQNEEDWQHQKLFKTLHRWAEIINEEIIFFLFKLQIPQISLCVEKLRSNCYGHYRPGHNQFGLRREIALNSKNIESESFGELMTTLLHEMIHCFQEIHSKTGSGNYHNKEFQTMMAQCGIMVNHRGHHLQYDFEGLLFQILKKYGVDMPEQPQPSIKTGTSKLKKWTCNCGINVRVARADFQARCLLCKKIFTKA